LHTAVNRHGTSSRNSATATLAAYFEKKEEALEALRKLKKRGFHRIAFLHKNAEGDVRAADPFLSRRLSAALLAAAVLGIVFVSASLVLDVPAPPASLAGCLFGFLAGWISYRRSEHGIAKRRLKDHARWLVSDEAVLILQAAIEAMHAAVSLLRESRDIPPAVFILHPRREMLAGEAKAPRVPFPPSQLGDLPGRVSFDRSADPELRNGAELFVRLRDARRQVREICIDLIQAGRLEQGTPPTAEWILDNEYVVESNARDIRANLPPQFYRRLPSVKGGRSAGLPRVYDVARELVAFLDLHLDRQNISAFIDGYQPADPLTTGELWALPQMLRLALIESIRDLALRAAAELREREIADFWANRLIRASRRGSDQLFAILAELAVTQPGPSPYLAGQLVDHLYDEETELVLIQGWLERTYHQPLREINLREQKRQVKDQISIGNAFTSLRQLALLDWRQVFEHASRVEQLLRRDPAGVYPRMDFDTRDRYRRVVEELSRLSGLTEEKVAHEALALAEEGTRGQDGDERRRHVGAYLVGESRPVLVQRLHGRENPRHRLLQWTYHHSTAVYLPTFGALTIASTVVIALTGLHGHALPVTLLVAFLLLLPASQLVLDFLNYLVTRLLPPRALPKMDFKTHGIPDEFRTLVVVPVLLGGVESIRGETEKLEVRYLASRERNLLFSLFTDYRDAEHAHREGDAQLLQAAVEGIEGLNQRYGDGRFLLFHRERAWSESEQKFIGWERKRGKLEELNGLISGSLPEQSAGLVRVGNPAALRNIRFVLTLDSDTQLPPGAARRMIETLAHPLNQPRFDQEGRVAAGTYTIIQPRVSPSLPSASGTLFSRLFADAGGIDPYTRAVSDVHQDLTGEGSYYGKGIYDVRAFDRALSGHFPEERLLSHDLIEGAHVRVGLASDIELFDEFPQGYGKYAERQHRWIRGDWQIAQWISGKVPRREGGRERNPLSLFDRWKLFDNLRRSLVPVASVALLLVCWVTWPGAGLIATLVVAGYMLFRPLARPFTMATTRRGLRGFPLSGVARDVLRALADAAFLPHQAGLALDAIVRTGYRSLVSHRKMLQWTSTQELPGAGTKRPTVLMLSMAMATLVSAAVAFLLAIRVPSGLANAGPWLAVWLLSPIVAWILSIKPHARERPLALPPGDVRFLREIARRTWRYFDDSVSADTSWLPPDNYQVSPLNELAMRTSPTNIGLWMLSLLAARDFGYQTVDQVVEKLTRTMETIKGLQRFEGHLLNWYSVRARAPLEPRYISAVDSGNLLGALWTLEHGLAEMLREPVLDGAAFSGLQDTGRILRRILGRDRSSSSQSHALSLLLGLWEGTPDRLVDSLALLRSGGIETGTIDGAGEEQDYWAGQVEKQKSAWRSISDRYLGWMKILAEKSEEQIESLGPEAAEAVRRDLLRAPSLSDLAKGRVGCIPILQGIRDAAPALADSVRDWLERALQAFSTSQWLAGEVLGAAERLVADCRTLSEQINMRFLYDPERRLFSIGYNVSEGRRDGAFYDLLASEARLGSFVAIARGDVPFEHWFSLSRPFTSLNRRRVLLSWTGTMFEYLMPQIFQQSLPNTLLEEASRTAVAVHREYARRHGVPWGVSESAFADFDLNRIYQYRAFGVPALGLKRETEEKVVVAPYATLLAVGFAPRETMRNLRRLAALGLLAGCGYYDAVDFSRQPGRAGGRGVIVQAYMAHHQGMGFLSLANFLLDGAIRRRFHADGRVRAAEPLLYEKVPVLPSVHYVSTRERARAADSVGEVAPSTSTFDTALTRTPKTQLLSNGRYNVMLTNAGGGYSQWGAEEITRWRSDRTRDSLGTFFYIHDADSDETWSGAFQPCGGPAESYSASFALDRAAFKRTDNGIQTRTEVVVSPEDDVEVRRVTLINRSLRTRHLDCTSYIELSMTQHSADRQHPAFNKLFIQTEALPDLRALLAFRRRRGKDAPSMFVAHRLTLEAVGEGEPFRFETDRRAFVGRGRTMANPLGSAEEPHNTQGYPLDPILSLRTRVNLAPGQRAVLSLVLAAGETRERVVVLMGKYADPHAVRRAMDFAWAAAQLELRVLRIQPDDARRFQQLASHLLYPNRLFRCAEERIEENVKGQAGLWQYGISGDLPIALVTVSEIRDVSLVGQMLQAHTYWRMHGLTADLLILAEEAGSYEQPLQGRLEALIQAHSTHTGRDKPGGVFLRKADQIPEADLTLLHAAASIVLVGARGPLPQQVGIPGETPDAPQRPAWKRAPRDRSTPLPFLELPYFNGLGGFTPDGREYAIYLGAGSHTPDPWANVIANPTFGTLVSESGAGFTWSGNSQRNRLSSWSNDPVTDPASEALYIRDEETGLCWTPTASPIREQAAYRARHGAGYSVFEHNSNGISQELTVFVPMDQDGGQPVKVQRLRLKNDCDRSRTLSLTWYVEWVLGEHRETSQMHVVTDWDDEVQALMARNRFHPEYGDRVAFAALNRTVESWSGDRTSFLGRNGSLESAAAMKQISLSGRTGAGLDPCGALRITLGLAPGEQAEAACFLGQAGSREAARALILAFRKNGEVAAALEKTRAWWDELLGAVEAHTPELAADLLINRWLLYQSLSCRIWGRSAFYQSGGAFGFRDQLQDVMALLYVFPSLARDHIMLAASRQFTEGDVQHWWHPPSGAGIRSRISDDMLWLPFAVAHYLRVSGDSEILNTPVPFLDGPALREDQQEAFFTPTAAAESATLLEHCRRAVARGLTAGPHGLPLMGTGDWNDGMNLVGAGGRGESVWLGWFLVDVLEGMSEMSEASGLPTESREYLRQREALIARIEQSAWDGAWYIRAIFDDGTLVGSSTNAEARIDSIPQSWASLSGGAAAERARSALDSAWSQLVREDEGLALLFTPPFDEAVPSPGYIQAYPPGVRENGGQYTHAALWLAMALARRGEGTRAGKLLRLLNPIEHARDPESVQRYSVEPYALAADVYRLPDRVGRGGWSWYTGSAAWMYRVWVEEVLGLKVRGNRLLVDPVIPGWWNGFQVKYRHGEALFVIQVENPEGCERGVSWIEMDGRRLADWVIPLSCEPVKHEILVRMGRSDKR
jgi:cyclic beta-1,2-glucan glucanotransferase